MAEDVTHQKIASENYAEDDFLQDQAQGEPSSLAGKSADETARMDIALEETAILPATMGMLLLPPPARSTRPGRRHSPLVKALVVALLALLLLLTGASAYAIERPFLPASSAAIHITLQSQQLNKTYAAHVTIGASDATQNPIGAHKISFTTPAQSLTRPATGKQQEAATEASGPVQLINDGSDPVPFNTYDIFSNSKVEIEFTVNSSIHTGYVMAHAVHPGPGGNIKTYDVNALYDFPDAHATIYIINRQPFTGGHDASTLTVVSQSDIAGAVNQLTSQLQNALPADKATLKKMLAPSERLLDAIQCQFSVTTNRTPNEQASEVTSTGTTTCSATAYSPAKLAAYGAGLLQKDAYAQWGEGYTLIGQAQEKVYDVLAQGKNLSFSLDVQGHFVPSLSVGDQTQLASLIVGKTQASAQTLLLQQVGIVKVSMQVSGGLGTALPSSPANIHITLS